MSAPRLPAPAGSALFVYGTLRPGQRNWPVVSPFCSGHEPALLAGFVLYDLTYPCVVPASTEGPPDGGQRRVVVGDLLWITASAAATALARLDELEGYTPRRPDRSLYQRERHGVTLADGRHVRAWVYVAGPVLIPELSDDRRIAAGEWPPTPGL